MPSLTTSGSPTIASSKCTIDSTGPDRVRAPLSLLDPTQGWFAARIVGTLIQTDGRRIMSWRPDANNYIEVFQGGTSQTGYWRIDRMASGINGDACLDNYNSEPTGDITVIGAWTATQLKLSVAGHAFTAAANTAIPTFSGTLFDIGRLGDQSAGSYLNSDIYWAAAGKGVLSDADAVTINGFGNTDPPWANFPGGALISFLWKCDDFTYEDGGEPPPPSGSSNARRALLGVGR